MTLNASLDRFFEKVRAHFGGPLVNAMTAESLIAHLARDGFKILSAEELAEYQAWKDGELD